MRKERDRLNRGVLVIGKKTKEKENYGNASY